MLRVCRARQCIARHAELVLSATVSHATAYHGSLGHTDGGVNYPLLQRMLRFGFYARVPYQHCNLQSVSTWRCVDASSVKASAGIGNASV